jgi:ferredoxin
MAIVVTEKCRDCRFTECVTVCPVSCFHGDGRMLYIDPAECILCQACVPVCPVQAIYDEADLPPEWLHWVTLNAERVAGLPVIEEKQTPLKASA